MLRDGLTMRISYSSRLLLLGFACTFPTPDAFTGQIDPVLEERLNSTSPMEKIPVIIYLRDQVDLEEMEVILQSSVAPGKRIPVELRYRTILSALQTVAERTQPEFVERLARFQTEGMLSDMQRFWIRNLVILSATPQTIRDIAKMPEVHTVYLDGLLERDIPVEGPIPAERSPEAAESGLRAINAHKLWALGYKGQGRLVMGIDTGVNGNNLSFNARWRGAQPGVPASAAWFDPSSGTSFPSDCDGHGTHTMGTMTGLYAATSETLGVAPAAQWIASNSLCGGGAHTSRSIASFQWAANPDGNINTMNDVPDAICNSWYDPNVNSTQCNPDAGGYTPVIQAVEALGTAVVFSAGNNGPAASSVTAPKNRIASATDIFAVGAVDGNNPSYPIASFSSRGPSTCSGPDSLRIKPEVSAPGVSVRSASGTSGYAIYSGTSMATPHVVGAITVLRQVAPFLTGTEIKRILMRTAVDLGAAGEDNTYGHGMIDMWAAYLALPLNMGYVKGQVTSGGNPLGGVAIDFVEGVQQVPGTTTAGGQYRVNALIDTPFTSTTYTLRAQKFGYLTFTDTVTIVLGDTVTRNIVMTPAPAGTLEVRTFDRDSIAVGARVQVRLGNTTVGEDSTNPVSGIFSTSLPPGSYTVIVDGPSPFATRTFSSVALATNQTTVVHALLRHVIEIAPAAVSDTLFVGESDFRTVTLTNTTNDVLAFSISDDNALARRRNPGPLPPSPPATQAEGPVAKGTESSYPSFRSPEGRGGPDAFGYEWIDSNEFDGPIFSWVNIAGTGTMLDSGSAWVQTNVSFRGGDEGYFPVSLPFPFPFYGVLKDSLFIGSNGNIMFQRPTGDTWSTAMFPTPGGPIDSHIGVYWDDLEVRGRGRVYFGMSGENFVVQYDSMPLFNSAVSNYTFQIILKPGGEWITQYRLLGFGGGSITNATIGMENVVGTIGLTVVRNAAYAHNSLAIRFFVRDALWLSQNPQAGTIPPGGQQNITITFNASGLTADTTYNGRISIETTHPDAAAPFAVPATLRVIPVGVPLLTLGQGSVTFAPIAVNTIAIDTVVIRNAGQQTLGVSSMTSTNGVFAVSPANATIPSGDSVLMVIHYLPATAGTDTGRVIIMSSSHGSPRTDVLLNGSAFVPPQITVSVSAGWDIISNPVGTPDDSLQQLFPSASFDYGFAYSPLSGYSPQYVLENGKGYWTKFPQSTTHTLAGISRLTDTINVGAAWNLIGSISVPVNATSIIENPPGIKASPVYGFQDGYVSSPVILPGRGYWIKTNGAGTLVLQGLSGPPGTATTAPDLAPSWGSIHVKDALGREQILHLGAFDEATLSWYELPPVGPDGAFDVRFESGRMAEHVDAQSPARILPFVMRHASYPVRISWEIKAEMTQRLALIEGQGRMATVRLVGTGQTIITDSSVQRLIIAVEENDIPVAFGLSPNYPNPFNPETHIRIALPEECRVTLRVYNALGQEVRTLLNTRMDAGYETVLWDGKNTAGSAVTTGIYFYRMEAGGISGSTYRETRKMLLIK